MRLTLRGAVVLLCCVTALWTEYAHVAYVNSLAPNPALYTIFNASLGFGTSPLEAGPGSPYQFPITYNGC